VRFIRDGKFVSAAGVMSGIEMSLWLVEQIWGIEAVEKTKSYIAYDFPERSRSTDRP
jgi:transcriptional regulator GlxA family with amidase domain